MHTIFHRVAAGIAAASLVTLAGCSNKTAKAVGEMNKSNIQRIANMYSAFQQFKGGKGPKDEAEFKQFVKDFAKENLTMMGIDPNNTEAIFVSERDGKPFKIRYKVPGGRGAVGPVAFEQEGIEGTKQVAFTGNSKVEDVDDARYKELWAGKGSSEPAGPPTGPPAGGGGRPTGRPPGAPTGPPGK